MPKTWQQCNPLVPQRYLTEGEIIPVHYSGPVVRPPHEAHSVLLEVTVGCTHNHCRFCTFYKDIPYRVASLQQIEADLQEAAQVNPRAKRVYAVGGDPFSLRTTKLLSLTNLINRYLPRVNIGMYARITSIFNKTIEDLKVLRQNGINDLVIGIESGDDAVLDMVNKGYTSADIIRECKKLECAGIDYRVIFLGGLAGKNNGERNALNMANVLNQLNPTHMYMTSVAILPESHMYQDVLSGRFEEATEYERIQETLTLVRHLKNPIVLLGQSVANPVNFIARLPEEQQSLIDTLEDILARFSSKNELELRNYRETLRTI